MNNLGGGQSNVLRNGFAEKYYIVLWSDFFFVPLYVVFWLMPTEIPARKDFRAVFGMQRT